MGLFGQKPIKELKIPLACAHKNTPSEDLAEAIKAQPNSSASLTCSLMIAVNGNNHLGDGKTKYVLSLEDDLRSDLGQIVNMNHYSFIKLQENETKNFTFHHNHPKYPNGILEMIFDGMYGNMDICIRISTEKTNSTDCKKQFNLQADKITLSNAYNKVRFSAGEGLEDYKGTYHIEIKANSFSGVVFGVNEIDAAKQNSMVAREIKAGIPVTGVIHSWESPVFYSFELPTSLNINSIRLALTPIHGDFVVSMRSDDQKPTDDQDFWKTTEDSLMISSDDPDFKPSGYYTIGVFPLKNNKYLAMMKTDSTEYPVFDNQPNEKLDYKFQLKWSYTDKHSLLIPGLPDYGRLTHESECYMAEIWRSWKQIVIVKNSNSKNINLYASLGKTYAAPNSEVFDFRAVGAESGFELNEKDFELHCPASTNLPCNLHLCLYGHSGDEFMLAFTHDDIPFLLRDSKIFGGPKLVSERNLHFIYHPSKRSPTDIEEFSGAWGTAIAAKIVDASQNPLQFPNNFTSPRFSHSTLIHFNRSEIAKFENPLVLISVGKPYYQHPVNSSTFDFSNSFNLEAGYYLKELSKTSHRIGFASAGQLVYYYIYNNEPDADIIVSVDSLDGGASRIFMSKGNEARPTFLVHEKASIGFTSSYVTYTKLDAKARGYKDLRGTYVIAIQANTNIEYSVSWKNGDERLLHAYVGTKRHSIIRPGESIHVALYNTIDQDIDLHLKTNNKKLMVYYSRLEADKSFGSNDLELFPGPLNNKFKFVLEPSPSMTVYNIPEKANVPGIKHMFTFSNDFSSSAVELDFEFLIAGAASRILPARIQFGEPIEDLLSPSDEYRRYVINQFAHGSDIEMKIHLYSGRCEVKAGNRDQLNDSKLQAVKSLQTVGQHAFSLKQFTDLSDKVAAGGGVFLSQLYLEINCGKEGTDNAHYKFTVYNEGMNQVLSPNKIIEGVSSSDDKSLNTYLYSSTGNETIFNLEFTFKLHNIKKDKSQGKDFLKSRLSVYFAEDKSGIDSLESATIEPIYEMNDYRTNRILMKFKPKRGVFMVKINSIKDETPANTFFDYTLRLNTEYLGQLTFGKYLIDYLPVNVEAMTYEIKSNSPGQIFFRMHQCFGSPNLLTSGNRSRLDDSIPLSFDENKFTTLHTAENSGEVQYLQVRVPDSGAFYNDFGFLNYSKNASVYALEVIEEDALRHMSLDKLKPLNDNLYINLEGTPNIKFSPIWQHRDEKFINQVNYYAVVSKDPDMVRYSTYCEVAHLQEILKDGYQVSDAVQIFSTGPNPESKIDKLSGLPYHELELKLDSGHKYFMTIFAAITFAHHKGKILPMERYRVVYKQIEFEYRSFFFPLELLAATLGLAAVMIGTCWVVKNRLGKYLRKLSGFQRVSNEVDEELEDYYMQIKAHFEDAEREYRSVSEGSSNETTLNASTILPQESQDTQKEMSEYDKKVEEPEEEKASEELKPTTQTDEGKEDAVTEEKEQKIDTAFVPEVEEPETNLEEDLFDGKASDNEDDAEQKEEEI